MSIFNIIALTGAGQDFGQDRETTPGLPVISGFSARFRVWKTDRAVECALVPGADMASFGAADAVLHGTAADRAVLQRLLRHRFTSFP